MQDKLIELKEKMKKDNNILGEKMADALKDYLDNFMEELKKSITVETDIVSRPFGKIINCLVNKQDVNVMKNKHMYPVLDGEEYHMIENEIDDYEAIENINNGIKERTENSFGVLSYLANRVSIGYIFFASSYEDFITYTEPEKKYTASVVDKDGREHKIAYYLNYSSLVKDKIKKVVAMSKLYNDDSPLIYAPYAARFARIDIDISEFDECVVEHLNLNFSGNQIERYVKLNKEMIWNIKLEQAGLELEPSVNLSGSMKHYKYLFNDLKENQYIIPKKMESPTFQIRLLEGNSIEFNYENNKTSGFYKITIYDVNEQEFEAVKLKLYQANYNAQKLKKQYRLRSIGDVKYEVAKYGSNDGMRIDDISFGDNTNLVSYKKYKKEFMIYNTGRFGYKNTNKIYIIFGGNKDSIFFDDYINFVIGHLTYLYPEIGWEGRY